MNKLTDDLWALIRQFRSGTESEQQHAEQALKTWASDAVPLLIEEVEERLQSGLDKERLTGNGLEFDQPLHRLAMLLAQLGDSRGIPTLTRFAELPKPSVESFSAPLQLLLFKLAAKATRDDAAALLWLLRAGSPNHKMSSLRVIVALAERDPAPELQQVLTLIRPHFGEIEKILLLRRLRKALWRSTLPIPSSLIQSTENLPLPANQSEKRNTR
jgi:hypothetical protein